MVNEEEQKDFYKRHPDKFIEMFYGIELYPYQKVMINTFYKKRYAKFIERYFAITEYLEKHGMKEKITMFERNEKGKLFCRTLDTEIFFDDVLENCKNRKEVEFVVNTFTECLLLSAQDKLKDLGDEKPDYIEINL